jgi:hypothetical protein
MDGVAGGIAQVNDRITNKFNIARYCGRFTIVDGDGFDFNLLSSETAQTYYQRQEQRNANSNSFMPIPTQTPHNPKV